MTEQEEALQALGLHVGKVERVIGKSKWDVLAQFLKEPKDYVGGFTNRPAAQQAASRLKKHHDINCCVRYDIKLGILVVRLPDGEVVDTAKAADEEE